MRKSPLFGRLSFMAMIASISLLSASCGLISGFLGPKADSAAPRLLSLAVAAPGGMHIAAEVAIDEAARTALVVLTEPADLASLVLIPDLPDGVGFSSDFGTGKEPLAPFLLTLSGSGGQSAVYTVSFSFADDVPLIAETIGRNKTVRLEETDIGRFSADAALWYGNMMVGGLDFAFLNAGGIRGNLVQGPLARSVVQIVYPFPNKLTVLELSGADVLQMAHHASKMAGQGGFGVASRGYSYTVVSAADGFLSAGDTVRVDGEVVNPAGTYRVAVPDFLANDDESVANDGFAMLRNRTKLATSDAIISEIIYAYAASFPAGAAPDAGASRVSVDVSANSKRYAYVPADDQGSTWGVLSLARFFSLHESAPTGYEFEIRLGAGLMDLVALGISLDLPPYVKLSGGWSAETVQDGSTILLTGLNGTTWRRVEIRGSEPRTLSNLVIDLGGHTQEEAVLIEGYPDLPVISCDEVTYMGQVADVSGAWRWAQAGHVMDLLLPDGDLVRYGYDDEGTENSQVRGTWLVRDGDLLEMSIQQEMDPGKGEWVAYSGKDFVRRWRFALIDGMLYRGAFTRIGGGAGFSGTFADVQSIDDVWMKRVLEIGADGTVTYSLFASTDPMYWHFGDYADGEGNWTTDPVAVFTASASGLPVTPESGTLYDIVLANIDIPDVESGTCSILMYDTNHIAIMPEGMMR
ncbi:MAG: hypothetical protein A2Z99_03340 [Treponema sp. GWB1_62_6]|nr:MAG: hypothetical protein A2413_05265 [Treponema sp. RIFOXYC1_FULL_61_9]OHE70063.1 MAG: hypothetical protein A2001_09095 [Treponema sp. GWC1_61_84]OHE70628.1 MAG: hypothetical protein A2Z99_03340 [Treponema sp. GWB1_62_6]HCM25379.1 hypothetical protein [Treponema sp.]